MMKRAFLIMVIAGMVQTMDGQLQEAVEKIRSDFNLMGISLATVCDGKITATYHAGLRDFDRNLPVNENTKYRIASISKLVMTTAMMKLYDRKQIRLDEDVSKYLGFSLRNPAHPDKPITVRMLLLHTGSINEGAGYDGFLMATYNNVSNPPSFAELLVPGGKYYTEDMWRSEAPGEYFTYCNANFGLAGTIIERITGQRFEDYMQQTLFAPMGISGSYIPEGVTDINNLAVLYRGEEGKWVPQTDDFRGVMSAPRDFSGYVTGTNGAVFSPQGGLRISAAELAKVMVLHINKGKYEGKRIISGKSIRLMHKPQWIYNGSNGNMEGERPGHRGMGVQILSGKGPDNPLPEGLNLTGHTGDAYGLLSNFFFDPRKKCGYVLIMNGSFSQQAMGPSKLFYGFEEAVIKALNENSALPCR